MSCLIILLSKHLYLLIKIFTSLKGLKKITLKKIQLHGMEAHIFWSRHLFTIVAFDTQLQIAETILLYAKSFLKGKGSTIKINEEF